MPANEVSTIAAKISQDGKKEGYYYTKEECENIIQAIRAYPINTQAPINSHILAFLLILIRDVWEIKNTLTTMFIRYRSLDFVGSSELMYLMSFKYDEDVVSNIIISSTQRNCILDFITRLHNNTPIIQILESLPHGEYNAIEREFIKTHILGGCRLDSKIPENSLSIGIQSNTSRFSSAIWYEAIQQKTITLAGVGGIGSYVGFLLSRMNPKALFIFDDDTVEQANMSGQLYCSRDIGKLKVNALSDMMKAYSNYYDVFSIPEKFTENCEGSDIMICGFDSMKARETFFKVWLDRVHTLDAEDRKHCLFIDGRLAAEELQVYCVTGDNEWKIEEYKKSLFKDEDAEATVCSYKQTSYTANMIGSIIVNAFINFVVNEMLEFEGRELPFMTQYNGTTMQLKLK